MPYLSRPVRRMCDDPIPGEAVTLVLRLADDADPGAVAERVRASGGTVERDLGRGALAVTTTEEGVAALVDVEGLAAVETEHTVGLDAGDAGEDVEF